MVKRLAQAAAAIVAAVVILAAVTAPPRQIALAAGDDGTVAGVVHVHTNRSDGRSSPEVVAQAASRAGLKFVILTDHGDGVRTPDPPVYRDGVLCVDGVEISTSDGHYVAIGMPRAPYALAGEGRGVVEDVARLGAFGVAAHPDSPKRELQWRAWDTPFDGLEIVSLDTSWRLNALHGRSVPGLKLLTALATYPFRPVETIADLARPTPELVSRWEALTLNRRVVGIAGTDAHAKVALVDVDPGENRFTLPFPGYESAFRALSVHVKPNRPLTGEAGPDAAAVIDGLRAGKVYVSVDGLATPASFAFEASNASGAAEQGDELPDAGEVTLSVRSNAPAGYRTAILRNGRTVGAPRDERGFSLTAPAGPAVYRVEIRTSDRPDAATWILSNPIYVRGSIPAPTVREQPPTATQPLFDGTDARLWRVEHTEAVTGQMAVVAGEIELRYKRASANASGSIALLASVMGNVAAADRLTFTARSSRPVRISVQLRTSVPGVAEERWQRTVYVDGEPRAHTIHFDELTPVGPVRHAAPPLENIPDVLFVIEPGDSTDDNRLWISRVALER